MEQQEKRLKSLGKALARLRESLDSFSDKKIDTGSKLHDQLRDSVIKRFEFSTDIFWKCLKDYLKSSHGIDVASPKSSLRECLRQKFITNDEFVLFGAMIDDRNLTSHCYEESMVQEIAQKIYRYHEGMERVTKRMAEVKKNE